MKNYEERRVFWHRDISWHNQQNLETIQDNSRYTNMWASITNEGANSQIEKNRYESP